ncbi:sporulation protein YunB [Bacillus shivajii]|uniref:sporulation protein YunB n=1 Tax=Bacillus shivajii TaxID=1983719 RepID=UPI001CFA031A|nr:sporulation protein YunB [Bacillus shivajii]UCZ52223.1 sporulation protein YunB [Bacillus shivajii]
MKKAPMFRIKKRKRGPLPFRYVFLISLLVFSLLTVQGLIIIEQGIRPTLMAIAKTETQRIGTLAINDALSKKIIDDMDMNELVEFQYDANGNLQTFQVNTALSNKIMRDTVKRVQDFLNDIEHGRVQDYSLPTDVDLEREGATFAEDGIIHTIPLGQATNNALLAHLGPRVPIRLSAIGDVKADVKEEYVNLGINNTYISISVEIEADVKVVIPFATDEEVVQTSIPIVTVWLSGEVPQFYSSGGSSGMAPAIITPDSENDGIQGFDNPEVGGFDVGEGFESGGLDN